MVPDLAMVPRLTSRSCFVIPEEEKGRERGGGGDGGRGEGEVMEGEGRERGGEGEGKERRERGGKGKSKGEYKARREEGEGESGESGESGDTEHWYDIVLRPSSHTATHTDTATQTGDRYSTYAGICDVQDVVLLVRLDPDGELLRGSQSRLVSQREEPNLVQCVRCV